MRSIAPKTSLSDRRSVPLTQHFHISTINAAAFTKQRKPTLFDQRRHAWESSCTARNLWRRRCFVLSLHPSNQIRVDVSPQRIQRRGTESTVVVRPASQDGANIVEIAQFVVALELQVPAPQTSASVTPGCRVSSRIVRFSSDVNLR